MNNYSINNNTPSFTGIYKLKNVDGATVSFIRQNLTPYSLVTHNKVCMFSGRHPVEGDVVKVIKTFVEECRTYSYDWLVKNAANYGIKLPSPNIVDTWVLTGKDADIFTDFLSVSNKKIDKKNSFFRKIIKIFSGEASDTEREVPRHLRRLLPLVKQNEEHIQTFNELLQGKKVVEVQNVQKLFQQMLLDA